MNKKNFIIDYTLYDSNCNKIKDGTVIARYKANGADAIKGTSAYLKALYPNTAAVIIRSCKEIENQNISTVISITVTIVTVAS